MLTQAGAILALSITLTTAQAASEGNLLTGRLYAADALPERVVGPIEEVHLVDLPATASQQAREDLHNRLAVFRIASGEAVGRPELRGTIARAGLYMAERYGLALSEAGRKRYAVWNLSYPPEGWESARNAKIACVRGDKGNPYIAPAMPCPRAQVKVTALRYLMSLVGLGD